jgi:hypothetical protein
MILALGGAGLVLGENSTLFFAKGSFVGLGSFTGGFTGGVGVRLRVNRERILLGTIFDKLFLTRRVNERLFGTGTGTGGGEGEGVGVRLFFFKIPFTCGGGSSSCILTDIYLIDVFSPYNLFGRTTVYLSK